MRGGTFCRVRQEHAQGLCCLPSCLTLTLGEAAVRSVPVAWPVEEDVDVGLLTFGAFARAAGLTPKALRLYDELDVLPPATVDPESGYRLYDPAQLERAQLIARLRRIGMPLADIRAVCGLEPAEAADSRVADVGCGTGRLTVALAASGHAVVGIDPAAASLDPARVRAGGKAVRCIHGTATSLPPSAFDCVVMTAHQRGLEPWTATTGCGTSRAVRHWDRAGARDQKPAAGCRQAAASRANVRRRASSGESEQPGGGGRFLTATLDAWVLPSRRPLRGRVGAAWMYWWSYFGGPSR